MWTQPAVGLPPGAWYKIGIIASVDTRVNVKVNGVFVGNYILEKKKFVVVEDTSVFPGVPFRFSGDERGDTVAVTPIPFRAMSVPPLSRSSPPIRISRPPSAMSSTPSAFTAMSPIFRTKNGLPMCDRQASQIASLPPSVEGGIEGLSRDMSMAIDAIAEEPDERATSRDGVVVHIVPKKPDRFDWEELYKMIDIIV